MYVEVVAAADLEKEEGFLVSDPGSPGGLRENVPARLNGKGIEIRGEDGRWHVVQPVGLGIQIIRQVWGQLWARHLHGG